MKKRNLERFIKKYSRQYPLISIVGPRQSGKTTLAKNLFPRYSYLSLESPDIRNMALEDPRGFLEDHPSHCVFDEVQRAPELFSYLQEKVDSVDIPGQYVLTGSQQFLLMNSIPQSLSGRIATFHLYPFTLNELLDSPGDMGHDDIFTVKKGELAAKVMIEDIILSGLYPRIHDRKLDPAKWIEGYITTYIERDIRSLVNIENLRLFEMFLKICASWSGQVVNFASISNAVGVSQPTVKKWISLLETSGIIILLGPYHANFAKRLIKSPKLYFLDTGILCYLLDIRSVKELLSSHAFGAIFETFVIAEYFKRLSHTGERPRLYFWRDRSGMEVDLIADTGKRSVALEVKSARTFTVEFKTNVDRWLFMKQDDMDRGLVVYRGREVVGMQERITAIPWKMMY